MTTAPLRKEEAFGLGLAVAAHVVLFAWLALGTRAPAPLPLPDKMTVTLSEEAALQSTSPEPAAALAASASAPELGEVSPQPAVGVVPQPLPETRATPQPRLTAPPRATAAPAIRPAGASRIGSDFLKGASGASASGISQKLACCQHRPGGAFGLGRGDLAAIEAQMGGTAGDRR